LSDILTLLFVSGSKRALVLKRARGGGTRGARRAARGGKKGRGGRGRKMVKGHDSSIVVPDFPEVRGV
jgi:hypothetical protein